MDTLNAERRKSRSRRRGTAALAVILAAAPAMVAPAQTVPATEAAPAAPAPIPAAPLPTAPIQAAPDPAVPAPAASVEATTGQAVPAQAAAPAARPEPAPPAPAPVTSETAAPPAVAAPAARPEPAPPAAAAVQPAAPAPASAPPTAASAAVPPAIPAAHIRFTGSSTVGDRLVPDLVDAHIAAMNMQAAGWRPGEAPNQRVQTAQNETGALRATVTVTGTPGAFAALNAKQAEIAMSSRPASAEEVAAYRAGFAPGAGAAAAGPPENVVALDGIAVIVNTENPVRKLKLDQIRDIYAGAVSNWSALGGPDVPIRLHTRDPAASGTAGFFDAAVMRRRAVATSAQRMDSYGAVSGAVAGEIGAIGFVPFAFVGRNRALDLVSSCGIEHEAGEFGVKTEDYPLARRLYLYAAPRPPEPAARFLRFAGSAAAYDAVRDAGYASLQPVRGTREHTAARAVDASRATPAAADGRYAEALLEYNAATRNALRLSATFRFALGSAQLDARARDDVERVAEFLRRPENEALRVQVLGFTDGSGAFGGNRAVSNQRASEVAALLRQRGVRVAGAKGFGPVAPVACDDDPNTATRNRRVEIWLGE